MCERLAMSSRHRAAFAAELRRLGPANFMQADGQALFAHGHRRWQPATGRIAPPGLHLLTRHCAARRRRAQLGAAQGSVTTILPRWPLAAISAKASPSWPKA